MSAILDTNQVLEDIPDAMKRLARLVVRAFYGSECSIVTEMLVRHMCMREEHIRALLGFDPKMLRQVVLALKQDKILRERPMTEERADGKSLKYNYYFINYLALVNVTKYKLDHMRRKLNDKEHLAAHRSLYKCAKCHKTYSDLDVGLLWAGAEMQCTFCQGAVDEDSSALPNQNSRSMVALFNEQMEPFVRLLQDCEDVKLAAHLLEPPPPAMPAALLAKLNEASGNAGDSLDRSGAGGGGRQKNSDFELYQGGSKVQIHIEGTDELASGDGRKEVPAWLQQSTIGEKSQALPPPPNLEESTTISNDEASKDSTSVDILKMLAQEQEARPSPKPKEPTENEDDSDLEDVREHPHMQMMLGGRMVDLDEITQDIIDKMTPAEKAEYTRISELAYSHLYE